MIKLTYWATDKPTIINPEKIARICGIEKGSLLYESLWDDTSFARVTESPEEVTRKILEYKLAMVNYSAAYGVATNKHYDPQKVFEGSAESLLELAGLEVSHDPT